MKMLNFGALAILAAVSAFALTGCGAQTTQGEATQVTEASHEGHDHEGHDHEGHDHEGQIPEGESMHGGWWCYGHGIPEEQCAMCDAELAAELREKGDWCEEHSRPESLCFKCDPSKAEKFVALYEAKYGKKPPQPTD